MKIRQIAAVMATMVLMTACSRLSDNVDGMDKEKAAAKKTQEETAKEQAYNKITAQEAKEMMEAGNVTVVDVRTREEYEEKHIKGALLIPNETIGELPPEALTDLEAVILVYCRSGVRSKQASDKLVKAGFNHIYDFGGIIDWPYDTVSGGE